ncbi:methyl-accepting chemotaxis protein [Pseudoalteromonas luteoviolacea B = ATCC 29581]|nr:methyl-accepting chemotaxis protein [Pseudoalteromonas luteoviolacea B = ATCC 29581]
MLNRISVKQKLVWLVVFPIVVFIAIGVFVVYEMNKIQHEIDAMFNNRVMPMYELSQVKNDYSFVIPSVIREKSITPINFNQIVDEVEQAHQHAQKEWALFKAVPHRDSEKQNIEALDARLKKMDSFLQTHLINLSSSQISEFDGQVFLRSLQAELKPMNTHFKALMEQQVLISKTLKIEGDINAEFTRQIIVATSVLLVILLSGIGFGIYRSIYYPLKKLDVTIKQITRDADLTKRVDIVSDDEIASISQSFNQMIAGLQNLVGNVSDGIMSLSSASEKMSMISSLLASTSEEQERQSGMIASAITQMEASIQEVSENAETTTQKAESMEAMTNEGYDVISANIKAVSILSNTVLKNAKIIQELNDQSNEINQVVLMIQSVAEQTNLLALNAAIEAARAGESGRGFAVVADEVRQLAHNTQKATENINEMISRLQSMSSKAVTEMSGAEKNAHTCKEQAELSAQIIQQIKSAIGEIVMLNVQVSTATEQQTSAVAEITQSINEFQESIAEINENAQQNASASGDLASLGNRLKGEVEQFTV